jgi:hypothetical protein
MTGDPSIPSSGAKVDPAAARQGIVAIERAIAVIQAEGLPAEIVAATQLLEDYADEHQAKYADLQALQAAVRVLSRRAGLENEGGDV